MTMELGFSKTDITPRVGVELCGFGPFINRHSTRVYEPLWARAMAIRVGGKQAVIVTCDLVGISRRTTRRVRALLTATCGLMPESVMICCSHTHSGPASGVYIGWGENDPPYLETLPLRIAEAAKAALDKLQPAELHHAEVPCEGIGQNREYDQFWAPYDKAMQPDWRPAKPELTDTTCHVLTGKAADGAILGFVAYFGCHPVVCCDQSRVIHGDYPGVALNRVERDHPGAVGLFLQGAQGDVNSAIGGQPEEESLRALEELAGRFARSVQTGITQGKALSIFALKMSLHDVVFSRKDWPLDHIRQKLAECETKIAAPDKNGVVNDASQDRRMQQVYAIALRDILARAERQDTLAPGTEVHGLRLGPLALLGSPFETYQAIQHDVVQQASAPIPLVISFVNDTTGYAVDKTCAARGGYATDMTPLICGELPYARIHEELVRELLELDARLAQPVDQVATRR